MYIETPVSPENDNEPDPLEKEWSEDNYPYRAWTNELLFDEEDSNPPGDYDIYALELLQRAHEAGVIDNADIWSLGVSIPGIIKQLKIRTREKGLDFQEIFKGFDIS